MSSNITSQNTAIKGDIGHVKYAIVPKSSTVVVGRGERYISQEIFSILWMKV